MKHDLTILERAIIAGVTITDETWQHVRKLVGERLPHEDFLARLRTIFDLYEPIWAKTLSDGMIAAWIDAHVKLIRQAGLDLPPASAPAGGNFGPPVGPPRIFDPRESGEPEPVIRYPKIEEAVNDLVSRRVVTADQYRAMSGAAKRMAFTVAKIGTEDTIGKIRNLLAEDVRTGGTLAQFQKNVAAVQAKTQAEAVAETQQQSALSPAHVETIYRTNVMSAYSAGQIKILQHPLVRDEFPYVLYSATHDSRTRPNHRALETLGIQGTAVYRADDPVIREFWAPWDFNCRCKIVLLTLEMAAERYGIREAQEWLRTGLPPVVPAFVVHPPFSPPEGWAGVFAGGMEA